MTIKSLTLNPDRSVTLIDDAGTVAVMDSALAGVLKEQLMKMDVRDSIRYTIQDNDGDSISMGSFDGTEDDFIDEVFSSFEYDIECGNYPDMETIQNAVIDVADSYGICID